METTLGLRREADGCTFINSSLLVDGKRGFEIKTKDATFAIVRHSTRSSNSVQQGSTMTKLPLLLR